jgi:hypothetical protein
LSQVRAACERVERSGKLREQCLRCTIDPMRRRDLDERPDAGATRARSIRGGNHRVAEIV